MSSNHKAVIANDNTISIYQAHQELALNTTNHNTKTNHKTTEDLNDKLEHIMTNTASTTQNEQLQDNTITNNDHDGSPQQHIQKNATQHKTKTDKRDMTHAR